MGEYAGANPQFYQRQQWYDWHFFKGSKIDKALSDEIQLQLIDDVFKATGLLSKKRPILDDQGELALLN
jgi:hypothetical protein